MRLDVIYPKDCSSMKEVLSGGVDLIVSGPPYWDYVDYSGFVEKPVNSTGVGNGRRDYEDFLCDVERWYAECWRVLRPGRYCVLNVGTVRKEGKCVPIPFHVVPILEKIGFEFRYDIVWHKISGGRRHARVLIRDPYPGRFTPNNKTEYLLVFQKQPGVPFATEDRPITLRDRLVVDGLFKREISNNVWHIMPAPPSAVHPCPFPPEVPLRLIELLSLKGETVLDPFMGIGTTARAAKTLGRHFIGYEVEVAFVNAATANLDRPLKPRRARFCKFVADTGRGPAR
jgi:site-specific DNA-methyltransferase (adenine-specific)